MVFYVRKLLGTFIDIFVNASLLNLFQLQIWISINVWNEHNSFETRIMHSNGLALLHVCDLNKRSDKNSLSFDTRNVPPPMHNTIYSDFLHLEPASGRFHIGILWLGFCECDKYATEEMASEQGRMEQDLIRII